MKNKILIVWIILVVVILIVFLKNIWQNNIITNNKQESSDTTTEISPNSPWTNSETIWTMESSGGVLSENKLGL
jgi:ABC-type cobalt transport system substrate-binding protein